MDVESITETVVKPLVSTTGSVNIMLNAWILAFRKLFEDIGIDRVIRKRLRKA